MRKREAVTGMRERETCERGVGCMRQTGGCKNERVLCVDEQVVL